MPNIRLLELDEIKEPKIREMIRQAEAGVFRAALAELGWPRG